jgi:uncharacterized protein
MLTKTVDIEMKAVGDDGTFQAYASIFGNIDSYGDVVVAGAFAESLAEYAAAGDPIAVYWRHRMDDPMLNIGECAGKEDTRGLLVDGKLDLENPNGAYTHKLMKNRRVRQLSFAYDVIEGGWVEKTEDGQNVSYYELRKLRLHEVSIVPVGANQETEILAVKAAREAAAAAAADDRQKAGEPGAADAAAGEDQGTADEPSDAKTEEPAGAKVEEPTTGRSKQHLGLINITTAQ